MTSVRIGYSLLVLLCLGACNASEQTPTDVGQKFEQGLHGNGQIVPDNDRSQNGPSDDSPVTRPVGAPQS